MIKIACCDDDPVVLDDLTNLLDRYCAEQSCQLEHTAYHSPLDLMSAIERGYRWDILVLDIVMPGESGMDLAREIRTLDDQVKIIFLTASPEFAVESYTVGAYFYLLKPIIPEDFLAVLTRAIGACRKSHAQNLILKCKTGLTAIAPDQLEYCEVIGHSLLLHMRDGTVFESIGKLDELEQKLLPMGGFLRTHRSYLVNMAYIRSISYRAVSLVCLTDIPIPHGKYNEIKKAYLTYAFENDEVML